MGVELSIVYNPYPFDACRVCSVVHASFMPDTCSLYTVLFDIDKERPERNDLNQS